MNRSKLFKTFWMGICLLSAQVLFGQSTYKTGFDSASEIEGWKQFRRGKTTNEGWQVLTGGKSAPNRIVNTVPTGDANKDSLVDWYVSPEFDFTKGGMLDSLKFNYFSYFGTFLPEQSVGVYIIEGNNDPALANLTLIADLTPFYSGDVNRWVDTGGIAIPNMMLKAHIGFKVVAVDGWSSISFDDMQVTSNITVGVKEVSTQDLPSIVPNPANPEEMKWHVSEVLLSDTFTLVVYASNGSLVIQEELFPFGRLDLKLEPGNYYYVVSDGNGNRQTCRLTVL